MKYLVIVFLLLPIVVFAEISVADMFSRPTMNKYEAEIIDDASRASTLEQKRAIIQKYIDKSWAGAPLFFNLGNVCYRMGDYSNAIKYYEKALEKQKFFLAYKNLGFAYSASNLNDKAYNAFACALAISGNSDVEILLWIANYRASEGDISSALAMCNQALIYDNSNNSVLYAKCRFLIELKQLTEAENLAIRQFEKTKDSKYLRLLVKIRIDDGDKCGAISTLEMLKSISALNKDDFELLGDLYFSIGAYAMAISAYEKNISNSKMINLALACVNIGDFENAKKIAEKLTSDDSIDKIKGIIYARVGENSTAVLFLEKYLQKKPADLSAVWELSEALYKVGKISQSSAICMRLLVDDMYKVSAMYSLLRNALALEQYNQALHWVNKLLKIKPSPEIENIKNKLEKYCNELEKSTQ